MSWAAAGAIFSERFNLTRFEHIAETRTMKLYSSNGAHTDTPVSDQILRGIVERGFFDAPGSLADARAACAELMFAREIIKAQTTRIAQLDSGVITESH
jgi:hypothetical protein